MNKHHEQRILADYRSADFNARLNLYLQWPHLRSELIQIDRHDINTDLISEQSPRRSPLRAQVSNLFKTVSYSARKLLGHAPAS